MSKYNYYEPQNVENGAALNSGKVIGSNDTSIGYYSLASIVDGSGNSAYGSCSLANSLYGDYNTAIGAASLYNMIGAQGAQGAQGVVEGSANTAVGANAGQNDKYGSCNTYLGASNGQRSTDSTTYGISTAIGYGAQFYPNGPLGTTSSAQGVTGQIVLGYTGQTVIVPGSLYVLGEGSYGNTGYTGASGAQGAAGAAGAQGANGAQGAQGANGAQGAQGANGAQGAQGANGAQGAQGANGAQGAQGANGAQGAQGATGSFDNTSSITTTGTITASSFYASSDYRIKENVTLLSSFKPEITVDDFKPVIYTNTRTGKQDIGFIAHELQEKYPFLVTGEKDGEEIQTVNYIGLIGVLVKEIQDLKKEVKELKNK